MQHVSFYEPSGFALGMPDHYDDIEKSRIVTHPVRRYFHGKHVQYTILACADYRSPHNIFYDLKISRPHDKEFPSSPYKDVKVFRQIITEFPVPEQAYIKAENKLRQKIVEKRLKLLQQRRKELMERIRIEMSAEKQYEIMEKKANEYVELVAMVTASYDTNTTEYQKVDNNMMAAESDINNMTHIKNAIGDYNDDYNDDDDNDDGDDDDYGCGVLGVYARGG